ncbi:hypothetical protein CVT26_015889 [Gymnopilus dilepis]|uniref:Cellobiose dehydrogenase cytochrome domain-containing protein n=1 Tax=Gymnopilus dilepis TaxID=231916 RepID=A0A409XYI3_9AGAR|nr:hypothetical protein CVT26_015889 [Gymnopilus dilepis]
MFFGLISVAVVQLLTFSVKQCVADNSLTTLPFSFTLAALNTTLPNANSTGAPLVLAIDGAEDGAEFYATSTYHTWPINDFPSLGLVEGSLKAFFFDSTGGLTPNGTDTASAGGELGWLSEAISPPPVARVFSAVEVPAHERPLLAVHGFHDLWTLCPFDDGSSQTKVIFNVTANVVNPPPFPEFNPANCYGVVINILVAPSFVSPSPSTEDMQLQLHIAIFTSLLALAVNQCTTQGAITNLPFKFTLAALNTTLPNANNTGAPLVLGQNGADDGIEFYVTSTYASYPYDDYPSIGLVDGSLRAYRADGSWNTNATNVTSGNELGWVTTTLYTSSGPQVYSAVRLPAYEHPILAAHGFHDLWSLCPFPAPLPQTNIIFNVTADVVNPPPFQLFDPADCYGVIITILAS